MKKGIGCPSKINKAFNEVIGVQASGLTTTALNETNPQSIHDVEYKIKQLMVSRYPMVT